MKHRLLISVLLAVVALVGTALVASAHGERRKNWMLWNKSRVGKRNPPNWNFIELR